MPITSTGYRSHFHQPGTREAYGNGIASQGIAWLDEEAERPAWKALVDAKGQGKLF